MLINLFIKPMSSVWGELVDACVATNPQDPLCIQALFMKRWAEQGCTEGLFPEENYKEQLCELLVIGQVLINWVMQTCGADVKAEESCCCLHVQVHHTVLC